MNVKKVTQKNTTDWFVSTRLLHTIYTIPSHNTFTHITKSLTNTYNTKWVFERDFFGSAGTPEKGVHCLSCVVYCVFCMCIYVDPPLAQATSEHNMSSGHLLVPRAFSRIRSSKVALSLACCLLFAPQCIDFYFQNPFYLASISRGLLFSSSRFFSSPALSSRTTPFPSAQLRDFFHSQAFSLTSPIQLLAAPRFVGLPANSTRQPLITAQKRFKCSKKPWFKPYKLKSHRLILRHEQVTRQLTFVFLFCI